MDAICNVDNVLLYIAAKQGIACVGEAGHVRFSVHTGLYAQVTAQAIQDAGMRSGLEKLHQ